MVLLSIIFLIACIAVTTVTLEKQKNHRLSRRKKKRYTLILISLALLSLFCLIASYVNADYNRMYGTVIALLQSSPL